MILQRINLVYNGHNHFYTGQTILKYLLLIKAKIDKKVSLHNVFDNHR